MGNVLQPSFLCIIQEINGIILHDINNWKNNTTFYFFLLNNYKSLILIFFSKAFL